MSIEAERDAAIAKLAEIDHALGCDGYPRETVDRVREAMASQARLEQVEDEKECLTNANAELRCANAMSLARIARLEHGAERTQRIRTTYEGWIAKLYNAHLAFLEEEM